MSNGRGKHKSRNRRRAKKTSRGLRRSSASVLLSKVQRVLLGGGLIDAMPEADCSPWRGVAEVREGQEYDKAQVEVNKRLYPHLFAPEKRGRR